MPNARNSHNSKVILAPSAEDRAAYAEFLQQPDTGLIRLLPREKYDAGADKDTGLALRGGGAYYSFILLKHDYGRGSDIALEQNYFSVGFAGADYGMLTQLGETPLESLNLEHSAVAFMANYQPPTDEPEIRAEARRFYEVRENGQVFSRRTPVAIGQTYLLRSISFEDSDVLVAFHTVRQDADGSVILIWKMLKKFPAPKMNRAANH